MTKLRPISLDAYKGVLNLSEHAKETAALAEAQNIPEAQLDLASASSGRNRKVLLLKV